MVVQGTTTDDLSGLVLHNLAFSGNSTFSTGTDPDVTIPSDIHVQLVQYTYNGVSNDVGLDIQDGSVTDEDGDETISVTPAP